MRKHCDTGWWTVELLGTGEHEPEMPLVLEEGMPQEGTSNTGPTEPQNDSQQSPSVP